MERKVALVTGASRGIGKVCAQYLARAGYDVAITARTVQEGEAREHSSTLKKSNTKPLPGSLASTAALVEEEGREALMVPADLLDPVSLGACVTTVLERWGRVDVVVHNGRYIGPGHMDLFMDTPVDLIEKQVFANAIAPLHINKLVLPGMIARGTGTIVNISSASGYADPMKPPGEGGWGLGYSMSKGCFHRVAGQLATEFAGTGVRVFNVQPNLIATERIAADMAEFGIENNGAPADVMGAVVAWLVTDPESDEWNGRNIEAQFFCHERGLLPGWEGPRVNEAPIRYDRSGQILDDLERELRERQGA
ncbi:MAG: SDR family oxidoreductase [Acidimicrobiales bacterium]|nr:SDR family oxidoreductase [Acidimicrobiales bacterium]